MNTLTHQPALGDDPFIRQLAAEVLEGIQASQARLRSWSNGHARDGASRSIRALERYAGAVRGHVESLMPAPDAWSEPAHPAWPTHHEATMPAPLEYLGTPQAVDMDDYPDAPDTRAEFVVAQAVVPAELLDLDRTHGFVHEESDITRMLGMLRDTLDHDLSEIADRLADGDVQGARELLHPIKGFVPMFAVDWIVDEVTLLEECAASGAAVEAAAMFDLMRPTLRRLSTAIKDELARRA